MAPKGALQSAPLFKDAKFAIAWKKRVTRVTGFFPLNASIVERNRRRRPKREREREREWLNDIGYKNGALRTRT